MRRLVSLLLTATLFGLGVVGLAPSASAGVPCGGSEVEVRGRVTDAATTLALDEVTSVGIEGIDVVYSDGIGTNSASRWATCLLPGTYQITFQADSYRLDQAAGAEVTVTGPGPIIVNAALTPRGRVLAGRVTNLGGAPRSASIGIWRLTSAGWRSVDGIGNHAATGRWSFRVPHLGRYRVAAYVDHHRARWAESETRLRFARTLVVTAATEFIDDVDIRVPYCPGPTDDFCVPPGFTS